MKLRISEIRSVVRSALTEMALPDRTKELERLYREFMTACRAGGFEPIRGELPGWWTIPGEQFEIPELANVDVLFYPDTDVTELTDEPYGMYRNTDPTDNLVAGRNSHSGTPRDDVPEESRRYRLTIQYDHDEQLWSKQRFLRALPRLTARNYFYHEVGHLITARVVPTKPHVNKFFYWNRDKGRDENDLEEIIGTTSEVFSDFYSKFANSPQQFKHEYPTVQDFVQKHPEVVKMLQNVSVASRPMKAKRIPGRTNKNGIPGGIYPDQKWVMKTISKFYNALSGS